ncbi:MAG TPA: medium chain dehydrogenase/reductase family protein [Sandaracinaceae bacterium LLY-WYZ-13_1]|nr:medium chain dehydrogenase/reductase family protein [Sandaracinaceae bacterium LLY-WYZ-13_1]
MRAVWIPKHGPADVLEVRETPDPTPGPGEVRIRVKAAGLNFAEVSARQGLYPAAPKPPCVVGYEGAGEVDALGDGVEGLAEGARVMFIRRFGGHADTACVPTHQVVPIPDEMPFEQAAAMPVNYLTAIQMLFRVRRLQPGDRALIHAAAGGVGTAALQLCRTVEDVTTFGTASAAKHDYVREQGCDHPIDYRSEDYVEAVRRLTDGEGVDLVCDALGGADWKKGYSLLRPAGMLVCFGLANAQKPGRVSWLRVVGQVVRIPRFNPLSMMGDNRAVAGVDLGSLWEQRAQIHDGLEQIVRHWRAGEARPHVDEVFDFAHAADAHRHLEERRNRGKVVLVP